MLSWPTPDDGQLLGVLRALPDQHSNTGVVAAGDEAGLFARAELHGVEGVVVDALRAPVPTSLQTRGVARQLDHEAHLALLKRVDEALHSAGLVAVALKGPLFAERFYARPSSRATSDIDLLIEERSLERATAVLREIGYVGFEGPDEERFRREHFHLHFEHAHALPLELHFHAFRGFGSILRSEPLIERAQPFHPSWNAIRVLAPSDELVYLAVHAATHRFVRLGWLYDLKLLVLRMTPEEIETARERARAWGFSRIVAFAAEALVDLLDVDPDRVRALGNLGFLRSSVLRRIIAEPRSRILQAATRLVYTTALCDSVPAAARYTTEAAVGHARRILAARGGQR